MEKNKLTQPKNPYISKYRLYGKIIFWIIFIVFISQATFVAALYLSFSYNSSNIDIFIMHIFVAGIVTALFISVGMIELIRWIVLNKQSIVLGRSTLDHNTLKKLKRAIQNLELTVYYQPQVNLSSGEIIGMEALIRWEQDNNEFISPEEFIPLAEKSGLIEEIDSWVLKSACLQNKQFLDQGFNLKVAVNLSALLFKNSNIIDVVKKTLAESQLPAANLELELTETAMIKDIGTAIKVMQELNKLGVEIAIDDFGTGYSSLSTLEHFPVKKIKIDKVFVSSLSNEMVGPNIVEAIVKMARDLNFTILVEGIETAAQRNYFINLGCVEGQGYLFSKPLSSVDFLRLIKNNKNSIK